MDSIYFTDPLGFLIELASYRFEPPWGVSHGQVMLEAHKIRVARGDVLLIDTRVWRHQASIPAEKEPSISIARDFSYVPRQNEEAFGDVDALLAARPAETGDVLFYESDLPDCELPRSKEDANCAVGEDQEGKLCLVATRRISTGEAFAMAPSSSSEDEEK